MKVCVSGASGLIGQALCQKLRKRGDQVVRLVRHKACLAEDEIAWNPSTGELLSGSLEGFDVFVNLAGENIANGRWTPEKKKKIYESRVLGTEHLVRLLSELPYPPKVLINASAVGFYGNRGEEKVDEESASGSDFLATVCRDWEKAASAAENQGVRVVRMRIGTVLSKEGGALQKMLLPFRLGLGGRIGSGEQYFSWIVLEDLLDLICFAMEEEQVKGAVNAVSPHPVTNGALTKVLGEVLQRPILLPLPAFAARFLFGEMADAILLGGVRVVPKKILELGFQFKYPDLKSALEFAIFSSE